MKSGVYCIKNIANGKKYIGSAVGSIPRRLRRHQLELTNGIHHNCHLQSAWQLYGPDSFAMFALEYCTAEKCVDREQHYIDKFKSADRRYGYNISPVAGNSLGNFMAEETKKRLSDALTGRRLSSAHVANMSKALTGRKLSEKHKQNIKVALARPDTKSKLSAASSKPRTDKFREAQRVRMSGKIVKEFMDAALRANVGRHLSEEHKAKLSKANKGKQLSADHRAKLAKAQTGKKLSLETREKIRDKAIARARRAKDADATR